MIGFFCGSDMPEPVRTRTNTMVVRFHSDNSVGGSGFSATYQEHDGILEFYCFYLFSHEFL